MNIAITGATGTLAAFLLKYFSTRAAFVIGTTRNLDKAYKPKNNEYIIEMDPLDRYSIDDAIMRINSEAGSIHAWLNIVGGFAMGARVEDGQDDWIYMYNTNFMTALNCCQQILPLMKKNGWGRIINIGARAAVSGVPLAGPYCASKIAVHSLTKTIALENNHLITCNAILPGIINTMDNKKNMPNANQNNWTDLQVIAEIIEKTLLSSKNGKLIKT